MESPSYPGDSDDEGGHPAGSGPAGDAPEATPMDEGDAETANMETRENCLKR